jgi:hypothetical protein
MHESKAASTTAALACAAGYPLLLPVLGWSSSPFNPLPCWGLAAEHGALGIEHLSLVAAAAPAALPLALASRFAATRLARPLLLASALSAALPYAVQPSHPFASNDSWLANWTWPLGALEVALAPPLVAGAVAGAAWRWRRAR